MKKIDKIFFIGRFPPPYGGATIKSEVLYNALHKEIEIDKFDTESKNKNKVIFFINLLKFIFKNRKQKGVICIASISLFKLSRYINLIDSNMLSNISVFVIGGAIDELIVENKVNKKLLNKYKVFYVECNGTKDKLNKIGLNKVKVIPNCRIKPNKRDYHKNNNFTMKCLFISRIDEKKGVFNIIEAFKNLPERDFVVDFYGPIDDEIKIKFNNEIKEETNINYKGVIESDKSDIYSIINKYDVLLFPTYYGEGYPGIITESKIAGIPVISSDFKYSREIIENNIDGILMEENTPKELINILYKLKSDKNLINKLRQGSYLSGEKCFIETYLDQIIEDIKN